MTGAFNPPLAAFGAFAALVLLLAGHGWTRLHARVLLLVPAGLLGPWIIRLVHDPLLALAVYYQGEPIADVYPRLRHLEYVDPAPAFRTGLLTDAELRPVDGTGAAAFANLRAAGSVLGGYDYAGGGCGFGVPLLTGWFAGRLAAG